MTPEQLRNRYWEVGTAIDRCALCGIWEHETPYHRFSAKLDMAHIISRGKGGKRANCVENVLFLCSSCHGAQHSHNYVYDGQMWPNITLPMLVRAKGELNELDAEVVASIAGWTPEYVLELVETELPEVILMEREVWAR